MVKAQPVPYRHVLEYEDIKEAKILEENRIFKILIKEKYNSQ
jgi:hypothetical protein